MKYPYIVFKVVCWNGNARATVAVHESEATAIEQATLHAGQTGGHYTVIANVVPEVCWDSQEEASKVHLV